MIVRQSTDHTCGQAALATLFSQIGEPKTEKQITDLTGFNEEKGVNMLALKKAAQNFNKEVSLKKWTYEQLKSYLEESRNPVLIHDLKKGVGEHFSVIRKIENGFVFLSDTEAGNIKYSVEDFKKVYTGNTLIIKTEDDITSDLLNDTTTDISDEIAATIWGKYVPVYEVIKNAGKRQLEDGIWVEDTRGKEAVKQFEACLLEATKKYNFQKERRNQYIEDRKSCYETLKSNKAFLKYITEPSFIKQIEDYRKEHAEEHADTDHEIKLELENYKNLDSVYDQKVKYLVNKNRRYSSRYSYYSNHIDGYLTIWKKRLQEIQEKLQNMDQDVVYYNGQEFTLGQLQTQIKATVAKIDRLSKAIQSKYSSVEAFERYKKTQIESIKREIAEITNKVKALSSEKALFESGAKSNLSYSERRAISRNELRIRDYRERIKGYERTKDNLKENIRDLEKKKNQKTSGGENRNYQKYYQKYKRYDKKADYYYSKYRRYKKKYRRASRSRRSRYKRSYRRYYKKYKTAREISRTSRKIANWYRRNGSSTSSFSSRDRRRLRNYKESYQTYRDLISQVKDAVNDFERKNNEIKIGSNKNQIKNLSSRIEAEKVKIKILIKKLKTLQSTSAAEDIKDLNAAKKEKRRMEAIIASRKANLKRAEAYYKRYVKIYGDVVGYYKKRGEYYLTQAENLEEEARKKKEEEFRKNEETIKAQNKDLENLKKISSYINSCYEDSNPNINTCEEYKEYGSIEADDFKSIIFANNTFNEVYIDKCLVKENRPNNTYYCQKAERTIKEDLAEEIDVFSKISFEQFQKFWLAIKYKSLVSNPVFGNFGVGGAGSFDQYGL